MERYEDINIEVLPKIEVKKIRGIYFLFRGNELVYIGSSINITSRIETHRIQKQKEFDSYRILELNGNINLIKVEARFIYKYKPIYNIQNLYSLSNNGLQDL